VVNNFTIDYSQGYGGVSVDFRMSYRIYASFNSRLIFHTISSQNIEVIGITKINYDIYRDHQHIWYNDFDFIEPILSGIDSFVLSGINLHNNVSCRGTVDVQFNVSGVVQYEKINFALNIIMPVNPYEIRQVYLMNLIWGEYGLGIVTFILLGLIVRTVQMWRREATYTEEDKKMDENFYNYLVDKLNKQRKESS
jgi:hypothetical protein